MAIRLGSGYEQETPGLYLYDDRTGHILLSSDVEDAALERRIRDAFVVPSGGEGRPTHIRITSIEEGMPHGEVFCVIGWTGFDQPVVRDAHEDVLLVLRPGGFEPLRDPWAKST